MLYFSLTTLTTTGYRDIVPVDPFARSLANLESVIGPLYLAITVSRLMTIELADRQDDLDDDRGQVSHRLHSTAAFTDPSLACRL